jgi:hypothetical protein
MNNSAEKYTSLSKKKANSLKSFEINNSNKV